MNQTKLKNLFDYVDGKLFWKVANSPRIKVGQEAGYLRKDGYRYVQIDCKGYRSHRLIFLLHNGYLPTEIDHVDGDLTNNKINNLREATRDQNMFNTKTPRHNTSGIKGVSWYKATGKWSVHIGVNNKKLFFGRYKDLELAELVAIEARNKYHGQFARHK
jgi:hypothetical protein